MEKLAVVLSTLGTVCVCTSSLLKGKNMKLILILAFATNALLATSYVLTGAYNGAVTCFVAAAQTIVNYLFQRKGRPIPVWLIAVYALSFTVVNLFTFHRIADILALLAALTFIGEICQKNGKRFRLWKLANTSLWIAYDLIARSFGPLSTHVILLVTILVGMVLHDRKKDTV